MEFDRYSYRYIEDSVRNGTLEDLEKHAVGPPIGTLRQVGSTIQPSRSSRTKFTSDDDRILVNWVVGIEQSGGATSGNEIYKQLEAKVSKSPTSYLQGGILMFLHDRILATLGSRGEIVG